MWIAKARLDVLEKKFGLARATLEQARLKNPKIPEVWLEAVAVEKQLGEHTAASALLARALRECPKSGILHAEAIKSAPDSTTGIARCWISVGLINPAFSIDC